MFVKFWKIVYSTLIGFVLVGCIVAVTKPTSSTTPETLHNNISLLEQSIAEEHQLSPAAFERTYDRVWDKMMDDINSDVPSTTLRLNIQSQVGGIVDLLPADAEEDLRRVHLLFMKPAQPYITDEFGIDENKLAEIRTNAAENFIAAVARQHNLSEEATDVLVTNFRLLEFQPDNPATFIEEASKQGVIAENIIDYYVPDPRSNILKRLQLDPKIDFYPFLVPEDPIIPKVDPTSATTSPVSDLCLECAGDEVTGTATVQITPGAGPTISPSQQEECGQGICGPKPETYTPTCRPYVKVKANGPVTIRIYNQGRLVASKSSQDLQSGKVYYYCGDHTEVRIEQRNQSETVSTFIETSGTKISELVPIVGS